MATIGKIVRKAGLEVPWQSRPSRSLSLTTEQHERIRTGEATHSEVAVEIGCSHHTIGRAQRRAGLKSGGVGKRTPKALDEKQIAEACQLSVDGWTHDHLGEKYGVHPGTIARYLRDREIVSGAKRGPHKKLTTEQEQQCIRAYEAGEATAQQLAAETGVATITMGTMLRAAGAVSGNKRGRPLKFTSDEVVQMRELLKAEMSFREIGRKYRTDGQNVKRSIERLGDNEA